MKRIQLLILLALWALLLTPAAQGQDDGSIIAPKDPDMVNPAANITFPPAVYVVRDSVDIRGTVAVAGLRNFFVEFRPLALDMMDEAGDMSEEQWFPATLPRITEVTEDILGTWNTVTLRDGLYELRLRINSSAEEPELIRVSPIRIENNPPPFIAAEQAAMAMEESEAMEDEGMAMDDEPEMEAEPEATETPDDTPRVIALVNSNVRAGDSILYSIVGGLPEGESAMIKGLSSFGTGWYYIEMATGRSGFIHPNIVRVEGDLSDLARINPPPLPPTPIPIPTAVPVQQPQQPQQPTTGPNLNITHVQVVPHPAKCNQPYSIEVTVINNGTAPAASGHAIEVRDTRFDGQGLVSSIIGGTPLAAGETRTYGGHLTTSLYVNELHHINVIVDVRNEVAETNESDNHYATAPYILGAC